MHFAQPPLASTGRASLPTAFSPVCRAQSDPPIPLSYARAGPPLPLFPLSTSVQAAESSITTTSFPCKIPASRALHDLPSTPPLPFVLLEPPEHRPFTGIWTERHRRCHCSMKSAPICHLSLLSTVSPPPSSDYAAGARQWTPLPSPSMEHRRRRDLPLPEPPHRRHHHTVRPRR
jgi:hypothetical protein